MGAIWIEWHADRRLEAAIYPSIEELCIAIWRKYWDFQYNLFRLNSFLRFFPPSSLMKVKTSGYVHGSPMDRMAYWQPIGSSNLSLYRGIIHSGRAQIYVFIYKLNKLSSFLRFSPPSSLMKVKTSGYVHRSPTDRMACWPPIRSSNLSLYRGILYSDMTQILGFSLQTV